MIKLAFRHTQNFGTRRQDGYRFTGLLDRTACAAALGLPLADIPDSELRSVEIAAMLHPGAWLVVWVDDAAARHGAAPIDQPAPQTARPTR